MLGKLLKYEIKSTAHFFLPLFGVMLALSLLIRMMGSLFAFGPGWITGLFIFIEVVLMIALGLMAIVITIQRFYKNLLGNEGYLMFTLPISTHYNILAKLIAATLWVTASGLLIGISAFIMVWENEGILWAIAQAWAGFRVIIPQGLSPVLMLIEWTLCGLLGIAVNILFLYLSMAVGQLFNERKFLASVGAFIALQFIEGLIMLVIVNILDALPFTWIRGIASWLASLSPATQTQLETIMVAAAILFVGGIYYFFTHRLLSRRLNLS